MESFQIKDVIAYVYGELGAARLDEIVFRCLKASGENFGVSQLRNFEELKKIFGDINGCEFDGPNSIIKEGWQEICYYEGYHFVCKDEYAEKFRKFFDGWNSSRIVINGIYDIAKSNIIK